MTSTTEGGMQSITSEADKGLVKKIRQLLIVFGYTLATLHLGLGILVLSVRDNPLRVLFDGAILPSASAMLMLAAAILFIGTAGLRRRKPWARMVLFVYATMWMASEIVLHTANIVRTVSMFSRLTSKPLAALPLDWAAADLQSLIYESIFPLVLIVCLRMPELVGTDSDVRRGFTPVLPSDDPL